MVTKLLYFTQKNLCIYKNILLIYMYLISLLIQYVSSNQKSLCFSQKYQAMKLPFISFPKESKIQRVMMKHKITQKHIHYT